MPPEQRHTIGSIRLHCSARSRTGRISDATKEANRRNDEISEWCRDSLPALLQEVFDQVSSSVGERIITLDALHLDMGDVAPRDLSSRLRDVLVLELKQAVEKLLRRELLETPMTGELFKGNGHLLASENSLSGQNDGFQNTDAFLGIISDYLDSGVTPWNALDLSPQEWAAKLATLLNEQQTSAALLDLLQRRKSVLAVKRLRSLMHGLSCKNQGIEDALGRLALQDAEDHIFRKEKEGDNGEDIEIVQAHSDTADACEQKYFLNNSGLILLSPLIPHFFKNRALLGKQGKFLGQEAQAKAVCLLFRISNPECDHLLDGDMLLPKILCGWPMTDPVSLFESTAEKLEEDRQEMHRILEAVISQWKTLGNASPATLVSTFIRRNGVLNVGDELHLHVEEQNLDLLLRSLPWPLSSIKTPWMEIPLQVHWL